MAKLTCDEITFEIRFKEYDSYKWVQYEVFFLYKGEPLVRDELLKRVNEYWADRSPHAFKVNEARRDTLIPVLRNVLETNEPDFWEPIEPDLTLAIFPETIFPMMPPKWELIGMSEEAEEELEKYRLVKEVAERLPSDPFTVIALIDAYNFGDTYGYLGSGPALILHPTRWQLRQFMEELEAEYADFCEQFGPLEDFPKPPDDPIDAFFNG